MQSVTPNTSGDVVVIPVNANPATQAHLQGRRVNWCEFFTDCSSYESVCAKVALFAIAIALCAVETGFIAGAKYCKNYSGFSKACSWNRESYSNDIAGDIYIGLTIAFPIFCAFGLKYGFRRF